jgi:DNA-binding LacI/PurR family transcriptional regulator
MGNNSHPVSLSEIAEKTGFSKSTVSRALHNNPRLSQTTREKIQAVAREMGWRPSAVISESMRSVRTRSFKGYQETIACILSPSNLEKETDTRRLLSPEIIKGMEEAADKFSCSLNYFNTRKESWAKIDRLLSARGIRRIVTLGSVPPGLRSLPQSVDYPALGKKFLYKYTMVFNTWHEARGFPGQIVRTDMFEAGKMAFMKAWRSGYRKIIILQSTEHVDIEGRFEAGLHLPLRHVVARDFIDYEPHGASREQFENFTEHWLDSLGSDTCLIGQIGAGYRNSIASRLQKPDPPGVIDLKANIRIEYNFSSVCQDDYEIGIKMIENVLSQPLIHRNALRYKGGHQLVSPIWHDGDSLPVRKCKDWNLMDDEAFDEASHQRMVCLNENAPLALECRPPERPCGGNEMAFPPSGQCLFHGIPFFIGGRDDIVRYCAVGDPDQHRQADHAPAPPASVEIPVNCKAQTLYFLHAATRVTERKPIARYRFHYRSKKPIEVPLIPYGAEPESQAEMRNTAPEVNIHDWYYLKGCMANRDTKPVCLINNYDPDHTTGYLYVWRWANPFPKSEITKIELLAEPGQEAVVLLFGVTAGMR